MNSYGRALLQLCMDAHTEFVSERSMTAPECIGHGRNRSTLGAGTSVVDHVLRVRRDATGTLTLPTCITQDHTTHAPAVQLLASDHCPGMFFCGPHTRTATVKRPSRVIWRLELLHQQQERDAYQLAVRARAHTALKSWLRSRATNNGAIRDRRARNFVAALRCWQHKIGRHRCSAAQLLAAPATC